VVNILKDGADAFDGIRTFQEVPWTNMQAFSISLNNLVVALSGYITIFAHESVGAAALFAEAAGSCIAILKDGVEGFNALRGFARVPEDAIGFFADAISYLVVLLHNVGVGMVREGMMEAVTIFAEASGAALGILSEGVEGFNALRGFAEVPEQAMGVFIAGLSSFMQIFTAAVATMQISGLEAAKAFADAAGGVLGLLADGVEGFQALTEFVSPSQTSIAAFAAAVKSVTAMMITMAAQFTADGIAAATSFTEAAGTVLDVLKSGVEGLLALAGFSGQVPQKAMDDFAASVKLLIL
jgi:hypothetical protein